MPLGYIRHGSTIFLLDLGWITHFEQGLGHILIEKIDFLSSLLIQKLLNYPPNNRNRGSDPHIAAKEQPSSISISQEHKRFLHGIHEGKEPLISWVDQANPVLYLARDQIILNDIFEEEDLRF